MLRNRTPFVTHNTFYGWPTSRVGAPEFGKNIPNAVSLKLMDLRNFSSEPKWTAVVEYMADHWDWFFTPDGRLYKPDFNLPHWDTLNGIADSLASKRLLMKFGWANKASIETVRDFDMATNSAAQQAATKAAAQKMSAQQKAAASRGQPAPGQPTNYRWLLPLGILGATIYVWSQPKR